MKAITRKEKIMSGENLTPITRKEMFLAKAAGQNVETPTPITREEMFLSMISCGKTDQQQYTAGLYQTGAIALYEEQGADAIEGMMIKSWDELLADETVIVDNGAVYTKVDMETMENLSSDALAGDLLLPFDGSITKLDGIEQVGYPAFFACKNLTSVIIPNSVIKIGLSAFHSCESLTSITIPNSVTVVDTAAFQYCTNLTNVTISNSITEICEKTFDSCGLTSVIIPASVTTIGTYAFGYCNDLTSVTIPNSVIKISEGAFCGCKNLSSITFEGSVAQWNNISKGDYWNSNVPATKVVCSGGEVSLV